jgi:hypothetical protein
MLLHRARRHENARLLSCFAAHLLDELPSLLRADRRLRGDATAAHARLTTNHRDVYADDRSAGHRPTRALSNAERRSRHTCWVHTGRAVVWLWPPCPRLICEDPARRLDLRAPRRGDLDQVQRGYEFDERPSLDFVEFRRHVVGPQRETQPLPHPARQVLVVLDGEPEIREMPGLGRVGGARLGTSAPAPVAPRASDAASSSQSETVCRARRSRNGRRHRATRACSRPCQRIADARRPAH